MANQFLIKETMQLMKNLSSTEITALQDGSYNGVQLLGYYEKGDTPAPIIYYLSPTAPDPGAEDNGSVIAVGGIKLEHKFNIDINVKYFGARGDGLNDDAPIINKAVERAYFYKVNVYIPTGIYLLVNTVNGANNKTFINPLSGVSIYGDGDLTVLFQGNNTLSSIIFPALSGSSSRVDNVFFRDFKIDCNGVNNLKPENSAPANIGIGIRYGENILVERVTIINNAGRQCLSFGANVFPQSITNLTIRNCRINNIGAAVQGNSHQNDHSAIYAQANKCLIENNHITNSLNSNGGINVATGIEEHSSNVKVLDNYIASMSTGINAASTVVDHINSEYSGNIFDGVIRGFRFWCFEGFKMQNTRISKNNFLAQGGQDSSIIDMYSRVNDTMLNTEICDNSFGSKITSGMVNGVGIGKQKDLCISNNKFEDIYSPILMNSSSPSLRIQIRDNEAKNIRSSFFAGLLTLDNSLDYISIIGNHVKTSGLTVDLPVLVDLPVFQTN